RRLEAPVVRAAGLAVLGNGPGEIVEERLAILSARAGSGAARRAVRDDEVSPRGDLSHRRLVRITVLRAATFSPDEDRILLGSAAVHGPVDGAALDPLRGIRLDDHLVRPGARHRPARVLRRGAGATAAGSAAAGPAAAAPAAAGSAAAVPPVCAPRARGSRRRWFRRFLPCLLRPLQSRPCRRWPCRPCLRGRPCSRRPDRRRRCRLRRWPRPPVPTLRARAL